MRPVHRAAFALALAAASSFALARVHPFGDAGLSATAAALRIPQLSSIPPEASALLESKCADCHSSQPNAPLYRHFAPVSWLLERDILRARAQMNLSAWSSYTADQQDTLKSKMLQQARSGAMPLLQYRAVHWSTTIRPHDIAVLAKWAHASGEQSAPADATAPGDATRGQLVFEKRCTGCHALTTSHEGPPLAGVFGRHIASVPGFPYSPALRQSNIVWDERSLDRWLTEPDSFIANSNMDFRVPKAQERQDLIAYFRQLSR